MPKAKIDIYDDGRAFVENKELPTMQIIIILDQVREALRQQLVKVGDGLTPESIEKMQQHIQKGRIQIFTAKNNEDEESSDSTNAVESDQLSDGEENTPESAQVDGHDIRNESRNGTDPEGLGDRPDTYGHDADLPDGAPGPGNRNADPDAGGDNG